MEDVLNLPNPLAEVALRGRWSKKRVFVRVLWRGHQSGGH